MSKPAGGPVRRSGGFRLAWGVMCMNTCRCLADFCLSVYASVMRLGRCVCLGQKEHFSSRCVAQEHWPYL